MGYVGVCVICLYSHPYKASVCKHAIIRLHRATPKSSLWNMEYVAHGGVFECPCIYRTSMYVRRAVYVCIYEHDPT